MKLLAAALLVALLAHFPHVAVFLGRVAVVVPALALHGVGYGLAHAWTLGAALLVVCYRLAAGRGWVR